MLKAIKKQNIRNCHQEQTNVILFGFYFFFLEHILHDSKSSDSCWLTSGKCFLLEKYICSWLFREPSKVIVLGYEQSAFSFSVGHLPVPLCSG